MQFTSRSRRAALLGVLVASLFAAASFVGSASAADVGSTTVVVQASDWPAASTGVTLDADQSAEITATGFWYICGPSCPGNGPDGGGGVWSGTIAPTAEQRSLVGSLDGGASWFAVGASATISGPGTLLLTTNDASYGFYDNTGSMTVTINVLPPTTTTTAPPTTTTSTTMAPPTTSTTTAPPRPTIAAQCKNNGWKTYGVFKNQGDCVSYVATSGRNTPAG